MEDEPKGSPSRRMKTGNFCIPRLRGNANTPSGKAKSPSPAVTLLTRFREAVLRLIMLSALSKANHHGGTAVRRPSSDLQRHRHYNPHDRGNSEALADCIEFIKKNASAEENGDPDEGSSGSMDARAETVIPVTVM